MSMDSGQENILLNSFDLDFFQSLESIDYFQANIYLAKKM